MQVEDIRINHIDRPLGFDLTDLTVSFKVTGTQATELTQQITVFSNQEVVYETTWAAYRANCTPLSFDLCPRTRYTIRVTVRGQGEVATSESWFETGKMSEPFAGEWLTGNMDAPSLVFRRQFTADSQVPFRLYMTGLGVYEAYLDGEKLGNEFLAPGVTAYDQWVQVQTYALDQLAPGAHTLTVMTGDGWYKGNFGFDGGQTNIYGDTQCLMAEMHVGAQVIASDNQWEVTTGPVTASGIYYGEDLNGLWHPANWDKARVLPDMAMPLRDRMSVPITAHKTLAVERILQTPNGETVLDFGQNQAGWVSFRSREAAGVMIKLEMGEILQDGNFYRDNLRAARAAFTYVADGQDKWVRPHFTYFGYRYVRVTGHTQALRAEDFKAVVLHSELPETAQLTTGHPEVDRLIENVRWSQKASFVDVPTDCPQRDERLGWTGDAAVFCETALINMAAYPFFKKYARDMQVEQAQHDGMLTMYAPAMGNPAGGASVWGDAAVRIPWLSYLATGDPAILRQNFSSMQSWVGWCTASADSSWPWTQRFEFGDWLALDGDDPLLPTGQTDVNLIAGVAYMMSARMVAQTARRLHDPDVYAKYHRLFLLARGALQDEYLTVSGRLAQSSQAAYALAITSGLLEPNELERVGQDLADAVARAGGHLTTGFVGTPLLCKALSLTGHHDVAVQLLLNDDYPSWLYAVKMGATSVWERWDSVLPDGRLNPNGMNSLNHYATGAVVSWLYEYVLGLRAVEPGYARVELAPTLDARLPHVKGQYDSPFGPIKVQYDLTVGSPDTIRLEVDVPVGVTVDVTLPRAANAQVNWNGQQWMGDQPITTGHHVFEYAPDESYARFYSENATIRSVMASADLWAQLVQIVPELATLATPENRARFGNSPIGRALQALPFLRATPDQQRAVSRLLRTTVMA